ncbi:MAG: zinc-dependent metalloprotease [Actinomycetota bacterium]|jgi:putative hydrolase|nr:zinc-dependent metalloprotease [Actinomycetota bacterium]
MTNPFGSGSNPFEFLLGDILKMLGSQMGMHAEMARQMAISVANVPADQPNVDPLDRIKYEELTQILQIHLQNFAALPPALSHNTKLEAVTRVEWASRTVSDWEKYANMLQKVAEVHQDLKEIGSELPSQIEEPENFTQMIQGLSKVLGPAMIAMQLGSMVGHLARVAFGSFEIAVPRPTNAVGMIIPFNVDSFAREWEMPLDQVRLWATLREMVMSTLLSVPLISERVEELISKHIETSTANLNQIQDRLTKLDLTSPEGLQAALSDPTGIFGPEEQSDAQRRILDDMRTTMAVIEGLTSNAMSTLGSRLLGNSTAIDEAFLRRRIERSDGERLSEQFFGIEITRAGIEQGQDFVRGVIERAGEEGLSPLWTRKEAFPTPSELEAPGLWLARLELEG